MKKKFFLLLLFFKMFCNCIVFCKAGYSSLEFLKINPDAFISSLGEGGYALEDYNLNNPASNSFLFQPTLNLQYFPWIFDTSYYFIGGSWPTPFGNVTIANSYFSYGKIQGFNNKKEPQDIKEPYDVCLALSFSKKFGSFIPIRKINGAIGVTFKIVQSNLFDYISVSNLIDFGLIYKLPHLESLPILSNISLGFSYQNFGTSPKFVSSQDPLPQALSLGLCFNNLENLLILADISLPMGNNTIYSTGISFKLIETFSINFGYRYEEDSLTNGPRIGFSLSFFDFILNYALVPNYEHQYIHKIGLKLFFHTSENIKTSFKYLSKNLYLAKEQLRRGNLTEAEYNIKNILEIYPGYEPAIEVQKKITEQKKKLQENAQKTINKLLRKSKISLSKGDIFSAKKYISEILYLDPENLNAQEILNNIKMISTEMLELRVKEDKFNYINKTYKLAIKNFNNHDYINAKKYFKEILSIIPDHKESLEYISKIDSIVGSLNVEATNRIFEKAIEVFKEAEALYENKNYEKSIDKYRHAIEYFDAVLKASPQRIDASNYQNICKNRISNIENEIKEKELNELRNKNLEQITRTFNNALDLYEREKYEEALELFTKANEESTKYKIEKIKEETSNYLSIVKSLLSEKYFKLGFSAHQQNQLEKAYENYKISLNYNPDNFSAKTQIETILEPLANKYYEIANKFVLMGEKEKAREYLNKSLGYKYTQNASKLLEMLNMR